jgi:hypothetical protein
LKSKVKILAIARWPSDNFGSGEHLVGCLVPFRFELTIGPPKRQLLITRMLASAARRIRTWDQGDRSLQILIAAT